MRPHAARGTQAARHRSADRELDRLLHRPAGAGGGGRDRADRLRPRAAHHAARRAAAADASPTCSSSTSTTPRSSRRSPAELDKRWGRLDGLVHAIAFVPGDALGGNFLTAPSASALAAFETSAFSMKALAAALLPLLERAEAPGGAIVGLDFDAQVAWPAYDWAGVSKAALESVNRYLARDLGPRGVRVEPRRGGPAEHGRGEQHRRLRRARRDVAAPGAARLGHERPRAGRRRRGVPPLAARPRDHRRDPPRRRRLPRPRRARCRTAG